MRLWKERKKIKYGFLTPNEGANHTTPISKTNILPALVEMSAQSFLIKMHFKT